MLIVAQHILYLSFIDISEFKTTHRNRCRYLEIIWDLSISFLEQLSFTLSSIFVLVFSNLFLKCSFLFLSWINNVRSINGPSSWIVSYLFLEYTSHLSITQPFFLRGTVISFNIWNSFSIRVRNDLVFAWHSSLSMN